MRLKEYLEYYCLKSCACKQFNMVKIKSHSNIIGGLLLSTLVWTFPLNFELETLAQVETVQTTEITKQEDNKQDHQKLLQINNKLQQ